MHPCSSVTQISGSLPNRRQRWVGGAGHEMLGGLVNEFHRHHYRRRCRVRRGCEALVMVWMRSHSWHRGNGYGCLYQLVSVSQSCPRKRGAAQRHGSQVLPERITPESRVGGGMKPITTRHDASLHRCHTHTHLTQDRQQKSTPEYQRSRVINQGRLVRLSDTPSALASTR